MTAAAVLLVGGTLAGAFWPRAALVDMAQLRQGHMTVTINEEGRTRVREPYVVSSPVAGELQRVELEPGDKVVGGETVVAQMRPVKPAALDVRTREQAKAAVSAAEAALTVARSDLKAAEAARDFAHSEMGRIRKLVDRKIVSQVQLERAENEARLADAHLDTMRAGITMREAEVQNALAQLISFDDLGLAGAMESKTVVVPSIGIKAPIDGTILKVHHRSETTLPAGQPILEIGDVDGDLEIVAELLSLDAVKVERGNRVIVTNWGGNADLEGQVTRIDPYGYTKHSALGVEEQRVETVIDFTGDGNDRSTLGHGYRVEVRIVVWESSDALTVPSSALFRSGSDWAVFAVTDGRAELRTVKIGQNNGIEAELIEGLSAGDTVILFPPSSLNDGQKVAQRQIQ